MNLATGTATQVVLAICPQAPPGALSGLRRLPWRAKISTPSSSSSSRMALEIPGCEVNKALAVSVRFRLRRMASCTKRNWCRFMSSTDWPLGASFLCLQGIQRHLGQRFDQSG